MCWYKDICKTGWIIFIFSSDFKNLKHFCGPLNVLWTWALCLLCPVAKLAQTLGFFSFTLIHIQVREWIDHTLTGIVEVLKRDFLAKAFSEFRNHSKKTIK